MARSTPLAGNGFLAAIFNVFLWSELATIVTIYGLQSTLILRQRLNNTVYSKKYKINGVASTA